MRTTKWLMALALIVAPVFAQAAVSTRQGMLDGMPWFEASESVTGQGRVIAIDHAKRVITVVSKADTSDITCGPEVKNFGKISPGDMIRIHYTQTLTIQMAEGGTPSRSGEARVAGSAADKPLAGTAAQRTHFSATILAIDKAKGTVTLRDDQGKSFTLTPRRPENLGKVKVGQLAHFTYDQVADVKVDKVKPKK